jgi:RNA polymerase-interacting CarD/CdnL/TRCF family regulator
MWSWWRKGDPVRETQRSIDMFQVGDRIVHPSYGVGTVTEIKERHTLARGKRYYSIELRDQHGTVVMVPVGAEERMGLRRPVVEAKLGRVWRVLRDDPKALPNDHHNRSPVQTTATPNRAQLAWAGLVMGIDRGTSRLVIAYLLEIYANLQGIAYKSYSGEF